MRSPSQHSIHRRLGRRHPSDSASFKVVPLDARSPQFGNPFGGGFRDGDRDDWFGGGRGNNDGPPSRRPDPGPPAGRPNPGPSFGQPGFGPPFGGSVPRPPFGGGDQRPPFGGNNPQPPFGGNPGPPPLPPAPPASTLAPTPTPAAPAREPAPANGQPQNGGGNPAGGDGSNVSNGGNTNGGGALEQVIKEMSGTGPQVQSSSSSSRAISASARGSGVQLPASVTSSPKPSTQVTSPSMVTPGTPLETVPAPNDSNDGPASAPVGAIDKKGLSGGIIAAIVLLILFFALLIILALLRRRWLARRSERYGAWWTNRRHNSRTYGDNPTSGNEKQTAFEWNRDDFAISTMDRSASPLDLSNIVPMAPPMAEVRRLRNGSDAHLVVPTSSERLSIGSNDSFVVHHPTPVAHRTSGTESFKFPKPPSHSELASTGSIHSRFGSSGSNSGAASVVAACGYTAFNHSQPSLLGSRPVLVPSSLSREPSADGIPNPFADDGSESLHNPFSNNSTSSIGPLPLGVGDLTRVEKIRRPFLPTMTDELGVEVDDEVKILQIFDDGWALVEKLQAVPTQGLIPLACLRDMGQGLTSLLSTRRVQSMHVSEQITE